MRKTLCALAFFLAFVPVSLAAQSVVTINPQQCVWRAGDDPAWAAPDLDESGWQPLLPLTKIEAQPRFWVRCHADLPSLQSLVHPALQVDWDTAYQLYLDGRLVGSNGSLASGYHITNSYETFPIAEQRPAAGSSGTIAIRCAHRLLTKRGPSSWPQLLAGDEQALRDQSASRIVAGARTWLLPMIGYAIVGVAGFNFLGLYLFNRGRRELLMLALVCWGLFGIRYVQAVRAAHIGMQEWALFALTILAYAGSNLSPFFAYWLNRRHVPLFYKIVVAFNMLNWAVLLFGLLLPLDAAFGLNRPLIALYRVFNITAAILSSSLIAAFLPWRTVAPAIRPLAICCFLWGSADLLHILPAAFGPNTLAFVTFYYAVEPRLLVVRAVGVISAVVVLVALLFRDQQRTAQERAELAGEMASAREIQQYLIPEKLPPTPGLFIRSVYHPSREVGGDFFQVLPDARDGSTFIAIGDVAGKGLKAGMLAALIVGAIRTASRFTSGPGEILNLLNERLQGRGLVTCLAMRIDRNGNAELANAGHLPPYINGMEFALEGAFPLGAAPGVSFPTQRLQLNAGETLLLLSDGVVEARNAQGELLGFERTAKLSTEPAEKIAAAAQAHGQEDDITVLTLALVPAAESVSGRSTPPVVTPA
jgi:hypothetical protein